MKIIVKLARALAAGAVAMSFLLGASTANAVTIVLTTGDNDEIGRGILNLDVNGATYNVDFNSGTANSIYGTAPRTYAFGNVSEAQAANDAIVAALNAHLLSEITLVGGAISNSGQYNIGYADNSDVDVVIGNYNDPTAGDWGNLGTGTVSATTKLVYAEFSPVPVPAAVWLFGSGLLGLIGVARRKKAA